MAAKITPGDEVRTPFGRGVVREVRNSGRLLVDVQGRALLIGPEGGFTADEARHLAESGPARLVSLGPRTLRAETAGITALTLTLAAAGDLARMRLKV